MDGNKISFVTRNGGATSLPVVDNVAPPASFRSSTVPNKAESTMRFWIDFFSATGGFVVVVVVDDDDFFFRAGDFTVDATDADPRFPEPVVAHDDAADDDAAPMPDDRRFRTGTVYTRPNEWSSLS